MVLMGQRTLGDALSWYQKKIASYDQPIWEKTIEERVSRGFSHAVPKKVARVKTELIDLDLIRGSYFDKAKPQKSWLTNTYLGILKVILLPFYLKWWTEQINYWTSCILLSLYSLQGISMYIYFTSENQKIFEDIPVSEVVSPLIMFIILGTIQSQIAPSSSHRSSVRHCQNPAGHRSQSFSSSNRPKSKNRESSVCHNFKVQQPKLKNETTEIVNSRHNLVTDWNGKISPQVEDIEPNKVEKAIRRAGRFTINPVPDALLQQEATSRCSEESGLELADKDSSTSQCSSSTKGSAKRQNGAGRVVSADIGEDEIKIDFEVGGSDSTDSSLSATKLKHPLHTQCNNDRHSEAMISAGESSGDECSPYSTFDSNCKLGLGKVKKVMRNIKISSKNRQRSEFDANAERKQRRVRLSLSKTFRSGYSSAESECSISSPTSPMNKLFTDLTDWPVLNSDCSSEEDGPRNQDLDNFQEDYAIYSATEDIPTLNFMGDNYFCTRSGKNPSDKVSCAIWQQNECQKVDLSVLDISSSIIRKVEHVKHSSEYFLLGFVCSILFSLIPLVFRTRYSLTIKHLNPGTTFGSSTPLSSTSSASPTHSSAFNSHYNININSNDHTNITNVHSIQPSSISTDLITSHNLLNASWAPQFVIAVAVIERFFFSLAFFFLLCVAERTFRERFLYWKYFGHLTSPRRAKLSELPHFRLNKVRNIKTWLSVRSYLQKHGPQHSIDVIVSSSFIIEMSILTFLCIQLIRETELCSEMLYCWEMVFWNLAIGLFIMRLMILGSKMNRKSRGSSAILLSEQINLYLQLEQKPHKKEKLNLANSVIKSAADLLKQLEAPFKISGLSANPYLYNVTKVIVLSAFSAALSELLGFKLKLFKIKI